MKKLLLLFLLQVAILPVSLGQSTAVKEQQESVSCLIDPYVIHNKPMRIPDNLVGESIYGNVTLLVHIATHTDEVAEVFVLRATLKRKADNTDYLVFPFSSNYTKVDAYPEKLKVLYPLLVKHVKGLKVEKDMSLPNKVQNIAYSIPVKIE